MEPVKRKIDALSPFAGRPHLPYGKVRCTLPRSQGFGCRILLTRGLGPRTKQTARWNDRRRPPFRLARCLALFTPGYYLIRSITANAEAGPDGPNQPPIG